MRLDEETQKELKEGQGQNLKKYRGNAEEEEPSKELSDDKNSHKLLAETHVNLNPFVI